MHPRPIMMALLLLACLSISAAPVQSADSPRTSIAVTTAVDLVDSQTPTSFDDLVANPGNDGRISLREAMLAADLMPQSTGVITISFAIPTFDPGYDSQTQTWQITLNAGPSPLLPVLTRGQVVLDGSSQRSGTNPDQPAVIIDGFEVFEAEGESNGLVITSTGNLIRGLALVNFYDDAIALNGPDAADNVIVGCLIGDTPRGDRLQEGFIGVALRAGANNNRIGGTTTAERNVIVGNIAAGVQIGGQGTSENLVIGNWIGIDSTGNADPNREGILLRDNASENQIGQPGAGNVISGNGVGIRVRGSQANTIQANWLGLGADGSSPRPNTDYGILLTQGASENLIGGAGAGEGNVIANSGTPNSLSGGQAIYLFGDGTDQNLVQGNLIGTTSTGLLPAGNLGQGILIGGGATENLIGGTAPGQGNVIVYNGQGGVRIDSDENMLIGNLIGLARNGTTALGNQFNGVRVDGNQVLISANTIAHSQAAGILVLSDGVEIRSNQISSNAIAGICIIGDEAVVQSNTITKNATTSRINSECQMNSGVFVAGNQAHILANTIHNNNGAGIVIEAGIENQILTNSITGNSGAGIILRSGGNGALNAPQISNVADTSVAGTACAGCLVEVFADDQAQGRDLLGVATATANGSFSAVVQGLIGDRYITATQTDAAGNTSPFAMPVKLIPDPPTYQVYLPGVMVFVELPNR
ncbi:MAG: hypothetical protein Fur005_27870 [Roseiflexaceae bacterium]